MSFVFEHLNIVDWGVNPPINWACGRLFSINTGLSTYVYYLSDFIGIRINLNSG